MNCEYPGATLSVPRHPVAPWLRLTLYFLASRTFLFIFAYLSTYAVGQGDAKRSRTPLGLLDHWDADWYLGIAREGYPHTEHGSNSTAFFPLFPLLVRLGGWLCHDLRVAGYLVSNLCLFGSCVLLWKLAARDTGHEGVADRAVLFFLFNPVTVFFSSIYSESLFFLLMVGTVYFARGRRWLAAGGCGFLAGLTRPVGVLLVSLLVAEFAWPYFSRGRERSSGPQWPNPQAPAFLVSVALTCAGPAVYGTFLATHFGDAFCFLQAEAHWHRHFAAPWNALLHLPYSAFYVVWFRGAIVLALAWLVLGIAQRIRPSYSITCLIYIGFYLSTNRLESIPRFLSVLFPFYLSLALAAVRFPRLEPFLLAGSVMLLALSTLLFVNGYWFT